MAEWSDHLIVAPILVGYLIDFWNLLELERYTTAWLAPMPPAFCASRWNVMRSIEALRTERPRPCRNTGPVRFLQRLRQRIGRLAWRVRP